VKPVCLNGVDSHKLKGTNVATPCLGLHTP
jgi:hypothetical protein